MTSFDIYLIILIHINFGAVGAACIYMVKRSYYRSRKTRDDDLHDPIAEARVKQAAERGDDK